MWCFVDLLSMLGITLQTSDVATGKKKKMKKAVRAYCVLAGLPLPHTGAQRLFPP